MKVAPDDLPASVFPAFQLYMQNSSGGNVAY